MHIVPIECILSLALYYLACDILCTTCRALYDGDRLHGSTLSSIILVVDVLSIYN
jgi:hypothetical protein